MEMVLRIKTMYTMADLWGLDVVTFIKLLEEATAEAAERSTKDGH
jgi:hypothetical protein